MTKMLTQQLQQLQQVLLLDHTVDQPCGHRVQSEAVCFAIHTIGDRAGGGARMPFHGGGRAGDEVSRAAG